MACCRRRVARPSCGAPSSGCSGVIGAPNSRVTINILYLRPRRGARLCRITAHSDQHGEVAVKCSLHSPRETPAENSLSHRFVVGLALPNTSPAAPFLGTFEALFEHLASLCAGVGPSAASGPWRGICLCRADTDRSRSTSQSGAQAATSI